MSEYVDKYNTLPEKLRRVFRIPVSRPDDLFREDTKVIYLCPQVGGTLGVTISAFLVDKELDDMLTVLNFYKQSKIETGTWEGDI